VISCDVRVRTLDALLASAATTRLIVFVADLFHPVDALAVQAFNDRNMRHSGRGGCAVPMLLTGWAPDDVARSDDSYGFSPALHEPATRRHDENLTERMRVPGGSSAGLEVDTRARAYAPAPVLQTADRCVPRR
jgi:hypothetical protein